MRRWLLVLLILLILAMSTTACGFGEPTPTMVTESEVYTDLAPMLESFPKLPKIRSVRWLERSIGDPRAPGPNDYDLEVVFQLDNPADLPQYGWTAAEPDWAKRVSPKLADQVPDPTSWRRSADFDRTFRAPSRSFGSRFVVQLSKGLLYYFGSTM